MINLKLSNPKSYKIIKEAFIYLFLIVGYLLSTLVATFVTDGINRIDFQAHIDKYFIPSIYGVAIIVIFVFLFHLGKISFTLCTTSEGLRPAVINVSLFFINTITAIVSPTIRFIWSLTLFLTYFLVSYIIVFSYKAILMSVMHFTKMKAREGERVLIIGAGNAGVTLQKEINSSDKINFNIVGFIDDDPAKIHEYIGSVKVLGNCSQIKEIAEKCKVKTIFIAIPSASAKRLKEISEICLDTKCQVKTIPGIYQLLTSPTLIQTVRDVNVQDLLGREPIVLNDKEIDDYIKDQIVLVTGGGGSIGSELCRQIALRNPKQLIIFDIYENNAYDIEQELQRNHPELNLLVLIGSIRDSIKLDNVFKTYRPDIVFHAAAHKHVPLMETSPNEAVKNNILGTYKVVKCADKYNVKRFVQISTDKAVNPTNIMGATKRVCEMIIQAYAKKSKTKFVAVRFGNVLGSNGSVIPLLKKQIAEGGPVTVTHKDIIRYFITIPEAVSLVLQAGAYANGGEIFVLDMGEQVKIYDLAVNLIKLSGLEPGKDIEIKITGLRPGEKLFEERLMAEEGMKKTANERISIGRPLEIDDEKLFENLDLLYNEAYNETDKMKELVKDLVPTYIIDKR